MLMWRLFFCRFSSSSGGGGRELRRVMQYVPTSVVVVTTRAPGGGGESVLRGVTCSSFTSVSAKPPVVSFCMQNPSRFHSLLTESGLFAVNILSETQANLSIRFSTPLAQGTEEENSQFKRVPHAIDTEFNLPLLEGCVGHLLCSKREFHQVGDHFVWYGDVLKTIIANAGMSPLLFFGRSYRSIGDDTFIAAFEDTTLPYDFWTHKAHLRMGWNYLKQYDMHTALNKVREGIRKFNSTNRDKIIFGYSETISVFYLSMVNNAIKDSPADSLESFEEFLSRNPHLQDTSLPFSYYSKEVFLSEEAKRTFVPPDVKNFDNLLPKVAVE